MTNLVEIQQAESILKKAYGQDATFREGQLEAILSVLDKNKTLVVQKTGWGKSIVYFIATKILRDKGAGPTIIVSPLLALMYNQVNAAEKIGIQAVTINSDNTEEWDEIFNQLELYDAIIVSPERLSNEKFRTFLEKLKGIELFVVDEAHSISDWGHDFRPDYQRIVNLLLNLPENIAVLGTTATANDRVINDIKEQLGNDMVVVKGNLIRENLRIQINPIQSREERLAWLTQNLLENDEMNHTQGIIYCLTRRDCEKVADYLKERGISAESYYSGLGKDENKNDIAQIRLEAFDQGNIRVLVSTIKLGMGYDKKDISFVIHYQLPQNLISYYQQIGRAGRDGNPAYAILLQGNEDEEIVESFIKGAQFSPDLLEKIILFAEIGVKQNELLNKINIKKSKLNVALKYLIVNNYIYKDGAVYRRNSETHFDTECVRQKQEKLNQVRYYELEQLKNYLKSESCYMKLVASELDAPDKDDECSICANCYGNYLISDTITPEELEMATIYLKNRHGQILPRKRWEKGGNILPDLQMQLGWVLSDDYFSQVGQKVKEGKYTDNHFSDELVQLSKEYIESKILVNQIDLVVSVPSLRRPNLVPDFSNRLALTLGIEFKNVVEKSAMAEEQKSLENSAQQQENIQNSINLNTDSIKGKTILLVDDMVDSRWSFTVIAAKLLGNGAKAVYPYALVKTGNGD